MGTRWLIVLLAAVVTMGSERTVAALATPSANDLVLCRRGCTAEQRACRRDARDANALRRRDCEARPDRVQCLRSARAALLADQSDCRRDYRDCRVCCASGGQDCSVPPTTTSTIPTTTTTTPSTTLPSTTTTTTLPQPQAQALRLDGRVVDLDGDGIAAATVAVGQTPIVLTTDGDGVFSAVVPPSEAMSGEIVVRAQAEGYADGLTRVTVPPVDTIVPVTITLQTVAVEMVVTDPGAGVTADTPEADGRLTIPGGALPTTNPVRVEFTPLDPSSSESWAFPGRDFLAVAPTTPENGNSGREMLESVVLADIKVTDLVTGDRIHDLGAPAFIELRLPAVQQSQVEVGELIPWWSLDEATGLWQREGDAEVVLGADGAKWARGAVTHFSWWNADQPVQSHTCLKARLLRASTGTPFPDLYAVAEGVTYSGESPGRMTGFATADGERTCFTIKRSDPGPERVRFYVNVRGSRQYLKVAGGVPPTLGDQVYDVTDKVAQATVFDAPSVAASCYRDVNTANCADFGTFRINLNLPPVVSPSLDRTVACAARPIVNVDLRPIVDPEGDEPVTLAWRPSGGTVSFPGANGNLAAWTLPVPPLPVDTTYTLEVDATDSLGATRTTTFSVLMRATCPLEITSFSVPESVDPRVTATAHFSALAEGGSGGPITYQWFVGNQVLTGPEVDWSVTGCGTQWMYLVVAAGTESAYRSAYIQVLNACPQVSLAATPAQPSCSNPQAVLTATATDPEGDSLSYRWFGTGVVDVDAPTTSWTGTPGNPYGSVTVQVRDQFGGTGTAWRYLAPPANAPPVVSVSANPSVVTPGGTATLTATASDDGSITSYVWYNVATSSGPTATFVAPPYEGPQWVSVYVTDDCGQWASAYTSIQVTDTPPPPPPPGAACSVLLDAEPASGTSPLFVVVRAPALGLDSPIPTYDWTFGDGVSVRTSYGYYSHSYQSPGTYTASVVVTDTDGSCSDSRQITVVGPSTTTTTTATTTSSTTTLPPPCANPDGGPDELVVTPLTGDTDIGWNGVGHNGNARAGGGSLRLCLSGCDGTTDPTCEAEGTTGPGSRNGQFFGSPFGAFVNGVDTCIVNRFGAGSVTGAFVLDTGEATVQVTLLTDVYLGNCPPGGSAGGAFIATIEQRMPLTTGVSTLAGSMPCAGQTADDACGGIGCGATCTGTACVSLAPDPSNPSQMVCIDQRGGIAQQCCNASTETACFPTAGGGSIVRSGVAVAPLGAGGQAWPEATYPKQATAVLASTYCIPSAGSAIDSAAGTPGPAAIVMVATVQVSETP